MTRSDDASPRPIAARPRDGSGTETCRLHEWVELTQAALERDGPPLVNSYEREIAAAKREALLARRPAQGPPAGAGIAEPLLEGTRESPITWLFEPESFAPLAKLVADERYSIVTDHLGAPRVMFDIAGDVVWSAQIDAYGELRDQHGPRRACPFRWPGQYEDAETGLYYNRFRYYDPQAGQYICSDPAGLAGGIRFFAYVRDPLTWADPLGLENIVFRALNPTDMTRLDAGESIAPKNPAANATPMDHVLHGSETGYGDQLVSVTRDRGLAESWARQHGTQVAEIDLDRVSSPVLDLSTGTGRTTHLGDASSALPNSDLFRANKYARGAKEMLVEGEIPREAVVRRYCA